MVAAPAQQCSVSRSPVHRSVPPFIAPITPEHVNSLGSTQVAVAVPGYACLPGSASTQDNHTACGSECQTNVAVQVHESPREPQLPCYAHAQVHV